jgi:dihydroneopterin aldolase
MSTGLLTIELTNLSFAARHGVYAEEQLTGNRFRVNVYVSFIPVATVVNGLEETINYVSLYEIAKQQMQQATPLLETVAMKIATQIHQQFPQVKRIQVQITKLQPPIARMEGETGVTYSIEF